MKTKRFTSLLVSAVLVAGMLTTVAAAPAGACGAAVRRADVFRALKNGTADAGVVSASGGMESVSLLTYNIDIGKTKTSYRIGETAVFDITVTRPAKEDPLGNGIPMERPYVEPAAGVTVGVGLSVGRVFLPGAAITDEKGVAKIKIKIESYAPAGAWADASVYAWKTVVETTCARVQEYGYQASPRMFKTSR